MREKVFPGELGNSSHEMVPVLEAQISYDPLRFSFLYSLIQKALHIVSEVLTASLNQQPIRVEKSLESTTHHKASWKS